MLLNHVVFFKRARTLNHVVFIKRARTYGCCITRYRIKGCYFCYILYPSSLMSSKSSSSSKNCGKICVHTHKNTYERRKNIEIFCFGKTKKDFLLYVENLMLNYTQHTNYVNKLFQSTKKVQKNMYHGLTFYFEKKRYLSHSYSSSYRSYVNVTCGLLKAMPPNLI